VIENLFFYLFAAITLGSAIAAITRKNAVHSAIFLIGSLLGVAGLFLLQHAEFLFATQIVVYIGGIMVLFLFVIMLVNLDLATRQRQFNRQWTVGIVSVLLVGVAGVVALRRAQPLPLPVPTDAPVQGNTEQIADSLLTTYLLPFELASILLLVAIVGSVIMARKRISAEEAK
jgi:NADH-quinone oxidoreductase subunit J